MKTIDQLANEFLSLKSALIFCHVRPDGDTVGSALALQLIFEQKGIACDIVCDGDLGKKFAFLAQAKLVKKIEEINKKYDAHIAVDIAAEHLFGQAWGIYSSCEKKYCIDHHLSNTRYTHDLYLETAPTNTILIYKLAVCMGVDFTKDIANAILLGTITDTGNFMHNSTNAECLSVASKMLEYGADMQNITNNIFKNQSKARSDLYLQVMSKMRFALDNALAIITISKESLAQYNLSEEVTEGFVDYPLTIAGVQIAASLLEFKPDLYRVSFRSKGKVNSNLVASEFGGGGHFFASGCVVSGPYEEVVEKIVRAVDINLF